MGLIQAIKGAIQTDVADQWKEYFYCDSLSNDVLVSKGYKRVNGKISSNTKGSDNIISNGSVIAVNEGQCMLIVEQGKIVEFCAEAGAFTYDTSTEPTLLYGSLGENLKQTFATIGKRFTFGGDTANDQRVYYINTKEILGNKYGTPAPVPFRVVDTNIGLDIDIAIRCNGEYTFKIVDPLLFYTNVTGNVVDEYVKDEILVQMRTELITALQPAFARISEMGIRYSAIPGHAAELAELLQNELSEKWTGLRGIKIASIGVNPPKASEEDEKMISDLQRQAVYRNPGMAAATLAEAQAEAMKLAAANEATGPMFAFAGMNMAAQAGGFNAGNLFQMDQANQQAQMYQNQMYQNQANPQMNQGMPQMNMGGNPQMNPGMQQMNMGGNPQMNAGMQQMNMGGSPQMNPEMQQMNMGGTPQMNQAETMQQDTPQANADWFCPNCGKHNAGNFCSQCGTKKPL